MLGTTNTLLLKTCPARPSRQLAVLTTGARVTSMWGAGELRYVTNDGYCGVRLDGETQTHEYGAEHVKVVTCDLCDEPATHRAAHRHSTATAAQLVCDFHASDLVGAWSKL